MTAVQISTNQGNMMRTQVAHINNRKQLIPNQENQQNAIINGRWPRRTRYYLKMREEKGNVHHNWTNLLLGVSTCLKIITCEAFGP